MIITFKKAPISAPFYILKTIRLTRERIIMFEILMRIFFGDLHQSLSVIRYRSFQQQDIVFYKLKYTILGK